MSSLLLFLVFSAQEKTNTPLATQFPQVAPTYREEGRWQRSDRDRALVLIQGLKVLPLGQAEAARPTLREWQLPNSVLVRTLTRDADLFAFAYAQTGPLEAIAEITALRAGVRRLKEMGYREVVLLGYSAGGIVARQLVEDNPGLGVSKVIQVCTPNAGSSWARLERVSVSPKPFVRSLTKEDRRGSLRARLDVSIPAHVEFVCVVGIGAGTGDGVVSRQSQWSEDLQAQGVPAHAWVVDHLSVIRSTVFATRLAELVCLPQPRWTQAEVAAARRSILGEGPLGWLRPGRDVGKKGGTPP